MKIIIIFLVGAAIGFWLGRKQPSTSSAPFINGDGEESQKEQRKQKILAMFNGQAEIKNDDVEKALGVSDATATNYLSELEKEGKIEQVGTVGRFVSYRKK